ncbi:MAG: N-acetyltransferase family protein [Rhodospirillales bacterium]|nr:N-acetyltransferase family protein [Rhodospirillales bacterium]
MNAVLIRDATMDDCAAIEAIYGPHVLHGLASWEEAPPDEAEIRRRMAELKNADYPFRVAELEGVVRGYAYAGSYRPRAAYRYCVENSLYVDREHSRKGIGGALLEDLIKQCTALGFRQMVAIIGDSANTASINLHAAHGFEHCGTLRSLGLKGGCWLDQIQMQRSLGEGDETLP